MADCVFCQIAAGIIPAHFVYQDDEIIAFEDIHPKAPVHLLLIPKEHLSTLNDAMEDHENILGRMMLTAKRIAREKKIDENGYRVLVNCNRDGGQEIFHLHMHLIGGRKLGHMHAKAGQ